MGFMRLAGTKRPAETPITAVDDAVASPSEAGSDAARELLPTGQGVIDTHIHKVQLG